MRHTTTVYYWDTEDTTSILDDIRDHEQTGWHVHQIAPRTNTKTLGDATVASNDVFVVYAKDDS